MLLEVLRRLPRRLLRALVQPQALLFTTVGVCALVLGAGWSFAPAVGELSTPPVDYAARYVAALQTGNVDEALASLAPEARAGLSLAARRSLGSLPSAERQVAEALVHTDRVDRVALLGRHETPNGSFVVYAAERDTPNGTQAYPLVVWLDREGRVLHTTP